MTCIAVELKQQVLEEFMRSYIAPVYLGEINKFMPLFLCLSIQSREKLGQRGSTTSLNILPLPYLAVNKDRMLQRLLASSDQYD